MSLQLFFSFIWSELFEKLMFYPLDSRNTKKQKTKTKLLGFYKQRSYFSQIVSKKAKITISFFMKNSKINNIIWGFSFYFYVFGFSLSNE